MANEAYAAMLKSPVYPFELMIPPIIVPSFLNGDVNPLSETHGIVKRIIAE